MVDHTNAPRKSVRATRFRIRNERPLWGALTLCCFGLAVMIVLIAYWFP
jgi:hypothetical protein